MNVTILPIRTLPDPQRYIVAVYNSLNKLHCQLNGKVVSCDTLPRTSNQLPDVFPEALGALDADEDAATLAGKVATTSDEADEPAA